MNGIEKIQVDDAAAMMSAFWPWIWKQQIKFFDRFFRQEIAHRVRNLDIQHADIIERGRFAACLRDATRQFIDPEKISLWHSLRQFAQE